MFNIVNDPTQLILYIEKGFVLMNKDSTGNIYYCQGETLSNSIQVNFIDFIESKRLQPVMRYMSKIKFDYVKYQPDVHQASDEQGFALDDKGKRIEQPYKELGLFIEGMITPTKLKLKAKLDKTLRDPKYSFLHRGFIPPYSQTEEIYRYLVDTVVPLWEADIPCKQQVNLLTEAMILAETSVLETCASRLHTSGIQLDWMPENVTERVKLKAINSALNALKTDGLGIEKKDVKALIDNLTDRLTKSQRLITQSENA